MLGKNPTAVRSVISRCPLVPLSPWLNLPGILITFTQFLITALFTWPSHFSLSHPPFFLKPRAIPLRVWIPSIVLFFAINTANNFAFGYNISVPVHIILRSGGSVMTMVVGYIWGRRYTRMEVLSVSMLTVGVIVAAMADAQSKVGLACSCNPDRRRLQGSCTCAAGTVAPEHDALNFSICPFAILADAPIHSGQDIYILQLNPSNRPPNPLRRPTPLRNHGSLRPINIRNLRLPLARKPLLQPLPRSSTLPSLPHLTSRQIPPSHRFSAPPLLQFPKRDRQLHLSALTRSSRDLKQPSEDLAECASPHAHRLPHAQCADTVPLHQRRKSTCGADVSAGRDGCAEPEEAGEFVY